ncbi:MAG: homocysteine S-methyltransferase [Candidatus Limivicinus sp.]
MSIQRASLREVLESTGQMVIDGSMSTALERMGVNLNHKLWTAKALVECPEKVKQVHWNYFHTGADCGITCSYQATIPGLMNAGYTEAEAEHIITESVRLFLEAREEWWQAEGKASGRVWPLCLAGIGPYGAYLADGSEYRGNYGVSDETLRSFHRRRMQLLWEAGADALLIETQPSLAEVLIAAELAEELQADYWISFSCRDGSHINEGDRIADCAKALSKDHPHLRMLGVNCTKPVYVDSLIRELRQATDLPIAVYPNSGEEYDPVTKTWHGAQDGKSFYDYALSYFKNGAAAVGGCCTTTELHVQQVDEARAAFRKFGAGITLE